MQICLGRIHGIPPKNQPGKYVLIGRAGNTSGELTDPERRPPWVSPFQPAATSLLHLEGAGVSDAGLSGFAAIDAPDAEEFLTAFFQVGFDGLHVFRRDEE